MPKPAVSAPVCISTTSKVSQCFPIAIPTNKSFTQQWHKWVYKKVSRHFKRNKDRIPDTVQIVFLRLLAKDMIGRWFFRHLTEELVDRPEAERILGLRSGYLAFISQVDPVEGDRGDPNSLWRIKDLLTYAKFDYERYYYSIQNHTLDSAKILKLLGYGPDDISVLESLYRQGRLKPAELTEHECTEVINSTVESAPHQGICKHPDCADANSVGPRTISLGYCNKHSSHRTCTHDGCIRKHFSRGYCNVHYNRSKASPCVGCDHGRQLLAARGLSLTNRWDSPESRAAAMKLRWNDSQLKPFLRDWRRQNMVKSTPLHIMRSSRNQGIDAGLLRYAEMIIDNAVVNVFKTLTRSDDTQNMVFNDGMSPELSNSETIATSWETDKDGESPERIPQDITAMSGFHEFEYKHDTESLAAQSDLTPDELNVVSTVDISEVTIREYATAQRKSVQQIHKIRNAALVKMRHIDQETISDGDIMELARSSSATYGVTVQEMLGSSMIGPPVLARTDFFSSLHARGMSAVDISTRFSFPVGRVLAAINRAARRVDIPQSTSLTP